MTVPYKYLRLGPAGRRLARIPRFGRLMARLPDAEFDGLNSAAAVFWKLYTFCNHDSLTDGETGMFDSGLRAVGARKIGVPANSEPDIDFDYRQWQVECCCEIAGAIAFCMTSRRERPQDFADDTAALKKDVIDMLTDSGPNETGIGEPVNRSDWQRWINAFFKMDSHELKYLTFSSSSVTRISWTDISTRAFFAALWACRWATDDQLNATRNWVPFAVKKKDFGIEESNGDYYEFWRMVLDLPGEAALPRREALLSPLYDGTLRDEKDRPIRSSELICESWELMRGTEAQRKFLREFSDILAGIKERPNQLVVAMELLSDVQGTHGEKGSSHFLSLAAERCGKKDNGHFDMGAPAAKDPFMDRGKNSLHPVQLNPYRLHRFCVTNAQYELFDPRHVKLREFVDKFKRASDLDRHPVVNVSSWDGLCFGLWLGEQTIEKEIFRFSLPTEAQWEYACRCGEQTPFTWGEDDSGVRPDGNRIELGYCNFDRWQTFAVDGLGEVYVKVLKNPWGFWQLHGNVWEWCRDWYDSRFYGTEGASQVDPENTAVATYRVLRGGSWFSYGGYCRSAYRGRSTPGNRDRDYSFRLAAVPCEPSQAVE